LEVPAAPQPISEHKLRHRKQEKKGVDSLADGSNICEAEYIGVLMLSKEDHTLAWLYFSDI